MGKRGWVQSWYPSGSTAWPIGARQFFVFVFFPEFFPLVLENTFSWIQLFWNRRWFGWRRLLMPGTDRNRIEHFESIIVSREPTPRTSRKKWHRDGWSFYEDFKSETRDKAVGKYRTKGGLSVKMGIRRRSKGEIVRVDTRWRRLRCHYGALFMHHQPPGTFNGEQYREGYVNKVVPLLKNNLPRGQSGDEKIWFAS